MDPSSVNSFLDQFLAVANSGFGLIQGDVTYVLNALIVISIVLAGAQWALAQEAPLAPFFRKVLFVSFFAFLINNWNFLATAINQSGAMLGLRAGGGGLTMAELHNPGRVGQIGVELFGRTAALAEGMNIITDFFAMMTIFLAAFFVMLGFFVLALQLFVVLIAFKLGSLVAFVALPWGVFNGTAWVAERPLGWVVGSAMRLFVLAFVASVSITFVNTLPATFTLDAGGVLNVLCSARPCWRSPGSRRFLRARSYRASRIWRVRLSPARPQSPPCLASPARRPSFQSATKLAVGGARLDRRRREIGRAALRRRRPAALRGPPSTMPA
jgi:P-type conjugative transfer protein TrbL